MKGVGIAWADWEKGRGYVGKEGGFPEEGQQGTSKWKDQSG